jgi:hypothetical protein
MPAWLPIATIILTCLTGLLIPFVAWLVRENTSCKVAMANMRADMAEQAAKFVTWEHMQKVERWREETTREFTEIRRDIQAVALAVAENKGARSHTGG